MDKSHWQKVEHLWQQARDIEDPEQRARWLDAQCGEDAALRGELESLLSAADQEAALLGPALFAAPPAIGSQLGPYRITRELGSGGMGVVLLAEQKTPITRWVAIKVLAHLAVSREARQRFEVERQILGRLTHPWIARLYDSGTTPAGVPYLVMEYVDGAPITEYCRQHQCTLATRIDLVAKAAMAVAGAHQRGIIHRDIKPGNILVHREEEQVLPKVIDFGIAKPMGSDEQLTATGFFPGTPRYMSPEQAGGHDIKDTHGVPDARTDVYSLGVLLYELLLDTSPFEAQPGDGTLRRQVAAGSWIPLGDRWRRLGRAKKQALATLCGTSVRTLGRMLNQDLAWVIHKAMAHQPEHRYQTVYDFARELARITRGDPVEATPPNPFLRLRALLWRNRRLTTASLVFLATVGGFQAWVLNERQEARRQAQRAAEERQNAEHVLQFVTEMFTSIDPTQYEVTGPPDLIHILERAENQLLADPDTPAAPIKAKLLETIGTIYGQIGDETRGLTMYRAGYDLKKTFLEDRHPDRLATRAVILGFEKNHRDLDALEQDYQTLLAQLTQSDPKTRRIRANVLIDVANLMIHQGFLERAKPYMEALDRRLDEEPALLDQASTLIDNAIVRANFAILNGRLDHAAAVLEQALEQYRVTADYRQSQELELTMSLGIVHQFNGNLDAAGEMLRTARDILAANNAKHGNLYQQCLLSLGLVYSDANQLDQSVLAFQDLLAVLDKNRTVDTLLYGETLIYLSQVHLNNNDFEKAEQRCRQGMTVMSGLYEKDDPDYAWFGLRLVKVLAATGRYDEALDLVETCNQTLSHHYGADHMRSMQAAYLRIHCLNQAGRYTRAIEAGRPLLQQLEKATLIQETYASMLLELGRAHLGLGRCEEGDALFEKGMARSREYPGLTKVRTKSRAFWEKHRQTCDYNHPKRMGHDGVPPGKAPKP